MALAKFKRTAAIPVSISLVRRASVLATFAMLASCGPFRAANSIDAPASEHDVVKAAGWTRIAATNTYLVVANVLPGEEMFTAPEIERQHPTEGELIIAGAGRPPGAESRHVEAHVYDRKTGLPLSNLEPKIVVLNRTTGERIDVESTLMQDVNIGAVDVHYGNNVTVTGNSDVRLTVTIGDEEVILDGHLD